MQFNYLKFFSVVKWSRWPLKCSSLQGISVMWTPGQLPKWSKSPPNWI